MLVATIFSASFMFPNVHSTQRLFTVCHTYHNNIFVKK